MTETKHKTKTTCFHCGDECRDNAHTLGEKVFCCAGCKTVYEILNSKDLSEYYALNESPGQSRKGVNETDFSFLENDEIQEKLLEFSDSGVAVITLSLPAIHCSSCIWLLENLHQLQPGVMQVQVNFPKRTARITFRKSELKLKELAELLNAIGYPPNIKLTDTEQKSEQKDRGLLYKFGIAGFAFGNVMIMALPEYFDYGDSTLQLFLPLFRWLMMALSVPVVFYSASDYFISAYKSLRHGFMNIDVPIALGILVLFLRSAYDVISQTGPGYFDSLAGLVFFLLLGKFFQRKTYDALSFERDYKSYFPVAVTKLNNGEESVMVNDLQKGDRIFIRNHELVPADAILQSAEALIDNSFVTGEATPVKKKKGDTIFAGGKQIGAGIEVVVAKPVNQSYLTQLWNHDIFAKGEKKNFKNFTDRISRHFTIAILLIATGAAAFWFFNDRALAFPVFTSILIVACPCALALSAPFTHGNVLRIFGRNAFFVKDAETVERLAEIDYMVWDKTGTLTQSRGTDLHYSGTSFSADDEAVFKAMARQSNHPLSRLLFAHFQCATAPILNYKEIAGKGAICHFENAIYKLGSAKWCGVKNPEKHINQTRVYLAKNDKVLGFFQIENQYRKGVFELINRLKIKFKQAVLSGDGPGEKDVLQPVFGKDAALYFNQTPADKLQKLESLQKDGHRVLMMGDGLNDAGALKQSDVGVSISEDINAFSPACDAILDAKKVAEFDRFLAFAKRAKKIILASFVLSFSYNLVGLSFAAAGLLSPVVSAILMPLSSITIVVFVTLASNLSAKKMRL